jgi:hypothetical protein
MGGGADQAIGIDAFLAGEGGASLTVDDIIPPSAPTPWFEE